MRPGRLAAGTLVAVALLSAAGAMMSGSQPATPSEIATALAAADPACRDLARERLRVAIARPGHLSRRTLSAETGRDCAVAAGQLAAVERDAAAAREVTELR